MVAVRSIMNYTDKRRLRQVKRYLKRAGSKRRRRQLRRELTEHPENASLGDSAFGRFASRSRNGIDKTSRCRRPQNCDLN
jgi:hypothetical protein